jgi:hypothetical protein
VAWNIKIYRYVGDVSVVHQDVAAVSLLATAKQAGLLVVLGLAEGPSFAHGVGVLGGNGRG